MQLLQFLSSPNPDTFASIDSTNYNGPSLCDEEEIIAKTVEHCMPGYIETDSQGYSEADATAYSQTDSFCYKVLDEKMTKDAGEAACGVDNDYGVVDFDGDYFTQKFMSLYTSGSLTSRYFILIQHLFAKKTVAITKYLCF
jgi:hypothetical protein